MHTYAIIPINLFNFQMLNGINYPIVIDMDYFKMIEYHDQPDPTGEGWVIFKGENANIDCAEYINILENDSSPL